MLVSTTKTINTNVKTDSTWLSAISISAVDSDCGVASSKTPSKFFGSGCS